MKAAERPEDLATFEVERDAYTTALTDWSQRQADALLSAAGAKADGPPDFYDLWAVQSPERQAQLAVLMQQYGFRLAQIGAWDVLGLWNPDGAGWDPAAMEAWLAKAAASHAVEYEEAGYAAATAAVAEDGDWRENLGAGMAVWVAHAATRAQTSATEARSFGSHDAAGASGLTQKVWRTGGRNPRASHKAQDGEQVAIDDVFSNGLRWPGDGEGEVKEVARCQCTLDYAKGA